MITVDDLPVDPQYAPIVSAGEFAELLRDSRVEGSGDADLLPVVVRGRSVKLCVVAVQGKRKTVYVYRAEP